MSWSKDTFTPQKVLVIPRKLWLHPDMTEKLFTGTLSPNKTKNQIWSPVLLNGKKLLQIKLDKLAANDQINRRFMFLKILTPQRCLPLPKGYIHVYAHYFQTSSSLKPLGQSKPNWSLLGKIEHKFCENGLDHMTKMAAMPIYGQNLVARTTDRPSQSI